MEEEKKNREKQREREEELASILGAAYGGLPVEQENSTEDFIKYNEVREDYKKRIIRLLRN